MEKSTLEMFNLNEQGGKMIKIIKRAGSNKGEQGGKNLENS